ncbi:unnamed protein product [Cylindrotheca closterium]|uniref:Uncharacterized protein n=1 Tax=Cylindrotheca closterium TaxID=2856 RepID=A0AAD2PWZ3_9STRA|nr:unnamed protein product [Cylindrotheca closterium]
MGDDNEEYQHIFYQLHTPGQSLTDVAVIQRRKNDKSLSILANLQNAIHKNRSRLLQNHDAEDLRLYAKGTTAANYPNEQPLAIDVSLDDERIQGTSTALPLLVVVSSPTPLLPAANNSYDMASVHQMVQELTQTVREATSLLKVTIDDESAVAFSKVTSKRYNQVMGCMKIKMNTADWKNKPKLDLSGVNFEWDSTKEDSKLNRDKYMAHLKTHLELPNSVTTFDGSESNDLLRAWFSFAQLELKGNVDVIVVDARHKLIQAARNHILMGIELKKTGNKAHEKIHRQVVLQHLAASQLNPNTGVLTLMTDLCDRWYFYWFKESTPELMTYSALQSEAKYLIAHFLDEPNNSFLPESFLRRGSWDSIFGALESIQEEGQSDQGGRSPEGGSDNVSSSDIDDVERDSKNTTSGAAEAANTTDRQNKRERNSGAKKQMQLGFASSNLDFMDEDERRDEIFRMVLQNPHNRYLFPEPEVETPGDVPPREILLG